MLISGASVLNNYLHLKSIQIRTMFWEQFSFSPISIEICLQNYESHGISGSRMWKVQGHNSIFSHQCMSHHYIHPCYEKKRTWGGKAGWLTGSKVKRKENNKKPRRHVYNYSICKNGQFS